MPVLLGTFGFLKVSAGCIYFSQLALATAA